MLLQILAKLTGIALKNNIEDQMTTNSMELRTKQNASANVVTKLHRKYDVEQEMIQNEMDACDDKTSDEYKELMAELKDSKEAEDKAVEQEEEKAQDYQNRIDNENAILQDRLTAISEDQEGWDNSLKDDIQKTCAVFAN